MTELSIYVHWPWCKKKCPYCDFNSHEFKHYDEQNYISAVLKDFDFHCENLKQDNYVVTSIYFGGGTPSLMQVDSIDLIIRAIKKRFVLAEDVEISTECNPTSTETKKMQDFVKSGVNRISIGVQSIRDDNLKFLGRQHSAQQALQALDYAIKATDNVSFDLIYGLPNQKLEDWKKDLEFAVSLNVKHISCYQLTIEPNTKFYNLYKKNQLQVLPEKQQAEFFDFTKNFLQENGYINYETSNFAKPGFECKHNYNIWQYKPYIGLGAGAHGRYCNKNLDYVAVQNIKAPNQYIKAFVNKPNSYGRVEILSLNDIAVEMLLLGLRLKTGVDLDNLKLITDKPLEYFVTKKLDLFLKKNIIKIENNHLKLTEKSYHLLNQVLQELLI